MKNETIKRPANLEIENATIRFKNFSGRESDFNPKGRRNFAVFLDNETAEVLAKDGWNVKYKKAREEGDPDIPYIQVAVNYTEERSPQIYRITGNNMTLEDAITVGDRDYAEIINADLIITPSIWDVRGKKGIKAYLSKAWITIQKSRFDDKYSRFNRVVSNTSNDVSDDDETPFD